MDTIIHNRILNTNSIRLAMGLEIEASKGDSNISNSNDMIRALRNHNQYSFLADKVSSEYIDGGGCEIVLPPLEIGSHYTNEFLKGFYDYLDNDLKMSVNKSCGHHIHIGLRPINISQLDFFEQSIERFKQNRNYYFQCNTDMINFEVTKDFVYRYCKWQDKISSMLPKSRRNNKFCMELSHTCLDHIKASTNAESLMRAMYNDSSINHYNNNNYDTKFYSVNLNRTYLPKNTIEIRQHSGTLSFNKINNFAHLMLGMFNHSYQNRVKLTNNGDTESFVMSNIFRPRTKLFKFYEIASRPNGATTQEIMQYCNIEDARSVRRTVNTIKSKYRTQKAVICNTQHSYGHSNGDSNGLHDLNGYKINHGESLQRVSLGSIQTDYLINDDPYCNIGESLINYFDSRIMTLS